MGEGSFEHNPFAPPSAEADFPVSYREPEEYRLAELSHRWFGSLIDTFLYVPPVLAGILLGAALGDRDFQGLGLALGGLGFIGLAGYQWYLISTTGQSLAKRWLKMRIIREDGSQPGFVHGVVLRSWLLALASAIPFLGSFVGLADALAIFVGTRRQTLHDRIARTLVVQV